MSASDGAEAPVPEAAATVPPGVPASAGALIFDRNGRLLILKPTYKSGWTIPGGVMEADGESPWQACQREVREECGLEVIHARLACIDFRPPADGAPGGIRFLFDCGGLTDDQLRGIELERGEVSAHMIVPLPHALKMLRKPIRRRVRAGTRHKRTVYLENGRPVVAVGKVES
ncbi:MAG TPA: NUDIX hydrolase [Streptosporangiaceae bacterium]|jgi:8-oxo-dGTP pyrophosphatase MutT (NUDIX family)